MYSKLFSPTGEKKYIETPRVGTEMVTRNRQDPQKKKNYLLYASGGDLYRTTAPKAAAIRWILQGGQVQIGNHTKRSAWEEEETGSIKVLCA